MRTWKNALICSALLALAIPAAADMKITQKTTMMGRSMDNTVLVKGGRERREMTVMPGFTTVMIYQCDAHKMITLNDRARTYTVINLDEAADAANAAPADTSRGARSSRAGGVVNVTSTSKDTGEHKKMQGYDARHLTTSMTVDGSASSCGGEKSMKMQVDGWYADIPNYMACANSPKAAYAARPRPNGGCNDKVNFKQEGSARLGFPMDVTTTMTDDKGQTFSIRQETVGVSTAPLDASLFDV